MLFPLWILFLIDFRSGLLLLDSDGVFVNILEMTLSWTENVIWKKGDHFLVPKNFHRPQKSMVRACEVGQEAKVLFVFTEITTDWINSLPDETKALYQNGLKKGGRKLDFPVGCLFFFAKKNMLSRRSRRSRRNEMEKLFLKFGAEAYKVDLRQESCSDSCCQTHWIPTQTLLSFFDAASANKHVAPPSCFFFPFHIPFGLMPATASEKILARLLCWTGNSTRGKSLEIFGHFHFPIWVPSSHREIQHKALQSQMSKQTSMHPWQNTVWGSMRRRSGSACAESQKESRMGFRSF